MKPKSLLALRSLSANRQAAGAFAVALAALLAATTAPATTLYWDVNGTAANVAAPATGAWDGTNAFWNTIALGTGGTPQAGTTNGDDLVFSSGSVYTTGTITASNTRVASSISFEDNIALTLAGPVSIGGTGTKSGIFVLSGDNAANAVSGALTLGAASTIQTAGTGVLSLTGGITGAFALTLQNNSTGASGITIATGSLNNTGTVTNNGTGAGNTLISAVIGANVTGVVQNSATSALTLSGLSTTFAGGVSILSGTVIQSTGATALGTGTLKLGNTSGTASATLTATGTGFTATNAINVQSGSSGNTLSITGNNGSAFVYSGGVALNNTLTLADTSTGSVRLSGIINDGAASNAVVIGSNNTGTVRLDGVNTFDGGITVKAGTLQLGTSAAAAGTGTILLGDTTGSAAATVTPVTALTFANPITVQAGSSGIKKLTVTTINATFSGAVTLNTGLTIGSTSTGTLTMGAGGINLNGNTLTIANTSTGRVFTDGVISGGGSVVINNTSTGDYVPRAAHTYSGGTTLTAGPIAVDIDSVGPVGALTSGAFGTGTVTLAGAQLRSGTTTARTVGNALVISGETTFFTNTTEKSLIFSGPVTLSGGTRTLTSTVGNTVAGTSVVFSGAIGDAGNNLGLTKAGTGNLTLAGANAYTGGTTVSAGVLNLTGSLAVNTALTVAAGGTLNLANGAANPVTSVSNLNLGAGTGTANLVFDLGVDSAGSDRLVSGAAATTANTVGLTLLPIAGFGTATTYSLIAAGSGLSGAAYSLTSGPGGFYYTLTATDTLVQAGITPAPGTGSLYWRGGLNNSWSALGGANTNWTTDAAGTTNAGYNPTTGNTVVFSASGATGTTVATTLDNSYTVNDLQFSANPAGVTAVSIAAGVTYPGTLTVAPSAATAGISVGSNAGNVTVSAPVVLGAAQTWSADGTGANGSSLTVSGAITGGGTNGLTITGGGTGLVTLSAATGLNTYSGPTTVGNGGILQSGVANSFSANSAMTITGTGMLRFNGISNTVASLSGNGTVQNNHAATAATLNVGDATTTADFSGTLQNGGVGTLALTKVGTGTQTLSGTYSHTGVTSVNGGILRLAGTPGTTALTVNSGGTLQFGTATALTNLNNVTLAGTGILDLSGNSPTIGTLTSASTTSITNSAAGTGTNTLTVNPPTPGAVTINALITDGATAKTAIRVANANSSTQITTNAANTFTGGLILANPSSGAGTRLQIGTYTGTPFGTGPITLGEAPTDKAGIYFTTAGQTLANPIVFNTALGTDRVGIRADAAVTLSGAITANLAPATFTSNAATAGAISLTNQVTGPSGLVLDIVSLSAAATSFNVTMNNATLNPNNYQGDTVINYSATSGKSATLALAQSNQLPNGLGTGNVIINSNGTGIGTLNLGGFSDTINGLSGNGNVDGTSGTPTLTLGDNNATASFSGVIQNTAGTLAVTKIGSGTQTLLWLLLCQGVK